MEIKIIDKKEISKYHDIKTIDIGNVTKIKLKIYANNQYFHYYRNFECQVIVVDIT